MDNLVTYGSLSAEEIYNADFWKPQPKPKAITLDLTHCEFTVELDDPPGLLIPIPEKIKGRRSKFSR